MPHLKRKVGHFALQIMGAAVVEWLNSCVAEQGFRTPVLLLAFQRLGIVLPNRNMTEKLLKKCKSSKQPNQPLQIYE